MTPKRLPAIAFRWSISAVFTLWLFAPNAQAQSAATLRGQPSATSMTGVYIGTYTATAALQNSRSLLSVRPTTVWPDFSLLICPTTVPMLCASELKTIGRTFILWKFFVFRRGFGSDCAE